MCQVSLCPWDLPSVPDPVPMSLPLSINDKSKQVMETVSNNCFQRVGFKGLVFPGFKDKGF